MAGLCVAAVAVAGVGLAGVGLWVRLRVGEIDAAHRDCLQRLTRLESLVDRFHGDVP